MFGLSPWAGYLKTSRCLPCRHIPWPHGWLPRSRRPPWPKGFPQLSFPSWGGSISSWSSDPWIRFLPVILHGLEPQWIGGLSLVGQRTSGQSRLWPRVCSPRFSWLTRLSVCLWSSMEYYGTLQIYRRHKGGFFWSWWASLVLSPPWIVRGIWSSNGSACGSKPEPPSYPFPKVSWLTTSWSCPTSWVRILSHLILPPPSWWGFGMGYQLDLGGLLLSPESHLGPKSGFSRCLPREPPWCAPL